MICWARYLFVAVISMLGIGQMIVACGQTGDLYLPKPEKENPHQGAAPVAEDSAPGTETPDDPETEAAAASDIPRPGRE